MKYNIHVTQAAERDMANAYDYIDLVLKNPTAADKLLDVADEKIGALAEFPHKFEVVSDKLLSLWGIRFTIVMNYLAFYTVDDATQTVHIVRFLYGKSNWITILKTDRLKQTGELYSIRCHSKRKFAGVLITEYFIWALTFVGAFSIGGKHDL